MNIHSSGRNPLFGRDRGKLGDSVFGGSSHAFDPSEFPSLGHNSSANSSLGSRPNYVGMLRQPVSDSSEFTMSHEDFPALPGASSGSVIASGLDSPASIVAALSSSVAIDGRVPNSGSGSSTTPQQQQQQQQQRRGIQTSPDGTVKNIPPTMVTDQFGMIGLLTFIRAAETDPNLVSLALGADLTTLGLNLNSEVNLYPTFGGPWAETPCRPQDIDFHVPHEYLTNQNIRDKLAPVKLNRYKDDLLFYMFYTNCGDVLQLAAAAELYNRDWRYHRDDRVWITRAPGMLPSEKTSTYERGTYYFFDVNNWRKVPKEFHLDYDKLEDRPSLPQTLVHGGGGGGGGGLPSVLSSIPMYVSPGSNAGGGVNADTRQQQHSPSVANF